MEAADFRPRSGQGQIRYSQVDQSRKWLTDKEI